MKDEFSLPPSSFSLLSSLWLHEPNAEVLSHARNELGLPAADPTDLASAYADVFLLNVYPYGAAFTDPSGELNGPSAQHVAALYEGHGYHPPELSEVGAADHVGLCLGFVAHRAIQRIEIGDFLSSFLEWAPVCCLAVEREPSAHAFYRSLAAITRDSLFRAHGASGKGQATSPANPTAVRNSQFAILDQPSDNEVRLHDLLGFFLAPARCGVFLSRSRLGQMAKALGTRLPFGSRFEVAEALFTAAGESEMTVALIDALEAEVAGWAREYRRWAEACPAWKPAAEMWLTRIAETTRQLAEMRQAAQESRP
ncbi:MAG: molecular chaperone TorD family protein [Chloroflexi bacterium]|nr:molecular chaperone TorD family protein [Chloroflexota bacterium]